MIKKIHYTKDFLKALQRIDPSFIPRIKKTETLFRSNPLHSSLRLHQLHGKLEGAWSISVTGSMRMIFKRKDNGEIIFVSIGHHEIYRSL